MADLLTRAVVARLVELREIASVIKSVIAEDPRSHVTFGDLAAVIGPRLYRTPSPAMYRDIRATCRLLGLVTATTHGAVKVVRGVRLR